MYSYISLRTSNLCSGIFTKASICMVESLQGRVIIHWYLYRGESKRWYLCKDEYLYNGMYLYRSISARVGMSTLVSISIRIIIILCPCSGVYYIFTM